MYLCNSIRKKSQHHTVAEWLMLALFYVSLVLGQVGNRAQVEKFECVHTSTCVISVNNVLA